MGQKVQRSVIAPPQGDHKGSPLLWTIWLAKRLRSIVEEPCLVDKYFPCNRLAANIIQYCTLSFIHQQSRVSPRLMSGCQFRSLDRHQKIWNDYKQVWWYIQHTNYTTCLNLYHILERKARGFALQCVLITTIK